MQLSINLDCSKPREVEQAARMLCLLAGLRVVDGDQLVVMAPVVAAPSTAPLPTIIPPADLPQAGLDTAQLGFGTGGQPTQTAQVIPLPVAGIVLDKEGLPWDERIHSSTKKQTDAGVWQLKRGVGNDPALLARVKAELLNTKPTTQPQATIPGPVVPPVAQAAAPVLTLPPVAPSAPAALVAPPVAPTLAPVTLAVPAPTTPPSSAVSPQNLQQLMQLAAPLMQAGKLTPTDINNACVMNGLPGMPALATATAEQVAAVWGLLPKLG